MPAETPPSAASHGTKSSKPARASKKPPPREPPPARPSASVLLISPQNHILLLHRVKTSSAFAAAHVFPGGNLDAYHDGSIPEPPDERRHQDSEAYRFAAIRETFEESGILLARHKDDEPGSLLQLSDHERDEGRKLVHSRKVKFLDWLKSKDGVPNVEGLTPFTRWVTPQTQPKRFSAQMYVYFLPLAAKDNTASELLHAQQEAVIPVPTHDGGIEHTAARFAPPSAWIDQAVKGEIILITPQFTLLSLIAPFLSPSDTSSAASSDLQAQRDQLKQFIHSGDLPWTEKCISPVQLMQRQSDGLLVLALDKPGLELRGTDRRGEMDRVVVLRNSRNVKLAWRKDVLAEERGKL